MKSTPEEIEKTGDCCESCLSEMWGGYMDWDNFEPFCCCTHAIDGRKKIAALAATERSDNETHPRRN